MSQDDPKGGFDQAVALQPLLGYLNFSTGKPDPRFQNQFHDAFAFFSRRDSDHPWIELVEELQARLIEFQQAGGAAFSDITQAQAVIRLGLTDVLAAYRAHHRDLLSHQRDSDLWQSFFLVRVLEAVLQQRGPWNETARIVGGALTQLNDYLGHRPVAVLENQRRGEIYSHERVRPIPLFLRDVGAASGKYHDLIERAISILEATPDSIKTDACFDVKLLDELALDPRAYDFNHPADKRPNYCFGEWDPHCLDTQGRYRRFVSRQILLDGLCKRAESGSGAMRAELIYESAAVLAGTILMASCVSGAGPQTHDSTVSLATLVPRIARFRDEFYAQMLPRVPGPHGERLKKEAKLLKQPFGGVRQELNRNLAGERALQLQQRQLGLLFAELGYPDAARRQTARIPVASVRILAELQVLLTTGRQHIADGRLAETAVNLGRIEELLKRGIDCGALVDPWNILGFAGHYPRFHALEDAVRDTRIDDLVYIMDQLFDLYGALVSEGASSGTFTPDRDLAKEMRRLADWWDRFATTTVSDIDHVHGSEATQSAEHVAKSLARWRQRGGGTADLAFWRNQLDGFRSAKAFALVVAALLQRRDFRASAALLATWLGQSAEAPLVQGEHSFFHLALRWMLSLGQAAEDPTLQKALLEQAVKFFDQLEANAEDYWNVPQLDLLGADTADESGTSAAPPEEDDSPYGAAYETMVYKDSADDDIEGALMEQGPRHDFDLVHEAERLESRLQFLATVARLWNIAARLLRSSLDELPSQVWTSIAGWRRRAQQNERALRQLLGVIHAHDVPQPDGAQDAMVEYDRRRSTKEHILNEVIATCLDHSLARTAMLGLSGESITDPDDESWQHQALELERTLMEQAPHQARNILPAFVRRFHKEPLLYTPLSSGGDPQLILRASLAQMILRGLVHNLPKQGLFRETYQLVRLARSMEANQTLAGPRITEFDRLFQLGVQAVVEAVLDSAKNDKVGSERVVEALETVVEPFAVTWRDHSETLRVAALEQISQDRDWSKLTDFIKRYGRELFHARFLALGNLRGIMARGAAGYLKDLQAEPDPLHPLALLDDLGEKIKLEEAERLLNVILQTLIENYDHLRDYNATTTQSDYGDNLYRLFDYLRLKAQYDRAAWLLKPLNCVHEVLAQRDGAAAALWRQRVEAITREAADNFTRELSKLERTHGIRLATIRDRVEERFVQPLVLDRLCALIEPALRSVSKAREADEVPPLEKEIEPFAARPSGVGLDVPPWLVRLQQELERVRTSQSELGNLAETMFLVPKTAQPFEPLIQQMGDWEQFASEPDA